MLQRTHVKWFGGGWEVWEGAGGGGQSVMKCKCCAEAEGTLRASALHRLLEQANATFPEAEFQGAECLGDSRT